MNKTEWLEGHRAGFLRGGVVLILVAVAAFTWTMPWRAHAQTRSMEITLHLDPGQSQLHWTLGSTLHTVHGTFAMKRSAVHFDPTNGSASGEFIADATSGESGNSSRDKKMHNEILESARYTEVVFRPDRIEGRIPSNGPCSVQVHGIFVLHGTAHELTVPVQAELDGDHWKGTANFSVPYIQWGLKSPNTFLLKADPAVKIELEMGGTMQAAPAQ